MRVDVDEEDLWVAWCLGFTSLAGTDLCAWYGKLCWPVELEEGVDIL